jgi:hypothetical protein
MPRARRLASIAAVAVLGLLALTGCRSDPAVAAYVGSVRIPDAKVTRIVEQVLAGLPEEQRTGIDKGLLTDQVVHFLVLEEVIDQYAAEHDITVPDADAEAFAREQNLPPDVEFTAAAARFNAALGALAQAASSVKPTERDQREAYEHAVINDQPVQEPFQEVRQYFDEEALGRSLGMRKMLNEAVADADVTINPRYDATFQLPVQISNARSWFAVELGGTAPVRDAPVERASQQPGTSGQG